MKRSTTLALTAALMALIIGGGVAFSAGNTPEKAARSALKAKAEKLEDSLMARLAKELGVSEARLRDAMRKAGGATIDDAVRQGLITKEHAAFLKARLGSEGLAFDLGLGRFKKHGLRGPKGFGRGGNAGIRELLANERARNAVATAVARKLGMTREALAKALGEDEDLEDLAEAKQLTEADLGAAAAAALKPYVEALVKAGTLERAAADALLQRIGRGGALGKIVRGSLFGR